MFTDILLKIYIQKLLIWKLTFAWRRQHLQLHWQHLYDVEIHVNHIKVNRKLTFTFTLAFYILTFMATFEIKFTFTYTLVLTLGLMQPLCQLPPLIAIDFRVLNWENQSSKYSPYCMLYLLHLHINTQHVPHLFPLPFTRRQTNLQTSVVTFHLNDDTNAHANTSVITANPNRNPNDVMYVLRQIALTVVCTTVAV
jgi:hypothetical protein